MWNISRWTPTTNPAETPPLWGSRNRSAWKRPLRPPSPWQASPPVPQAPHASACWRPAPLLALGAHAGATSPAPRHQPGVRRREGRGRGGAHPPPPPLGDQAREGRGSGRGAGESPESRLRSLAGPGKSPPGFPAQHRGRGRLLGSLPRPRAAFPGSRRAAAGPRPAPTLRLSRRDWRCFSAAPSARSRCRSSSRSARLAARSAAAMSPPSPGGSMRRVSRAAAPASPSRAPGAAALPGRAPAAARRPAGLPGRPAARPRSPPASRPERVAAARPGWPPSPLGLSHRRPWGCWRASLGPAKPPGKAHLYFLVRRGLQSISPFLVLL